MSKEPTAKFFCDFCSIQVAPDALVCPNCGHFFSSVKCPKCGHTGMHKEFLHGCKACGYAFKPSKDVPKLPPKASKKTRKRALAVLMQKEEKTPIKEDALPFWIYIVSIGILFGLLALFLTKL